MPLSTQLYKRKGRECGHHSSGLTRWGHYTPWRILQPLPQTRPGYPRRRNHSVPRFRVTFAFKGLLIPKFGILRRLGGPRTHTPETLKLSPRSQGVECVWEREGVYRVRDIVSSTKNGFSFMQPMNQLILDSAWASD